MAFAIRDYTGRTAVSVSQDVLNLFNQVNPTQRYQILYPTWVDSRNHYRSVFYIFNAIGSPSNWGDFFLPGKSFRQNNKFVVLALNASATQINAYGFDGTYNYTPAQSKTYNAFYKPKSDEAWAGFGPGLPWIFSAGVSPGYNTHRSKGDGNCKHRSQIGYETELSEARKARPHFISVISFNEWGEGTQIEPARTRSKSGKSGITSPDVFPFAKAFKYLGYKGTTSNYPNLYLDITDNEVGPGKWSPRQQFAVQ